MVENRQIDLRDDISGLALGAKPLDPDPSYSSDPNDWCPKHGPHPSD